VATVRTPHGAGRAGARSGSIVALASSGRTDVAAARDLERAQLAAQDALLVERVRRGDAEAYGELVTRHMRPAFTIAFRLLEHREDAEDVVQDAFVQALDRLATLEHGRPFRPWFQRIVVNRALNVRRSRAVRATEPIPDAAQAGTAPPDRAAERAELRSRLRAALDALPERQRVIVQLAELEDLSSGEIAEILGIADGTVRWHLHQAKHALRAALGALREEA
jgi:RNA polymerase sigma-70 factor, ECF subfamily